MTLTADQNRDLRADFDSLFHPDGLILLDCAAGHEATALAAGTMISDILKLPVRRARTSGPAPVLGVHVGDRLPVDADGTPWLLIRTPAARHDCSIKLPIAPWSGCSPVRIDALGWAHDIRGTTVIDSDCGAVLSRDGSQWSLNADLCGVYAREAPRHSTAESNVKAILAVQLVMRAVLSQVLPGALREERALSMITVDAEDQQRYFVNREGLCSNIRGERTDDLQFANSCRTIMERCEAAGLKAVFMVTGDELDASFVDAFGDRLIGLDDNQRVLQEMRTRGHDVAFHGFDHEWWIARGHSAITPMTLSQKLRYFFETSGDIRTLFGLARFLLAYAPQLWRARSATRKRMVGVGQPFSRHEIEDDFAKWKASVSSPGGRMFIRYPGYVRSPAVLEYLADLPVATVDSSDLYELADGLPAFPYTLLEIRAGVLRRTRVTEIPCLWIDKLLRTRDPARVAAELAQMRRLASVPGCVFSFITHTKVLGATWGHCHLYLHDPLKGMALPANPGAWQALAAFLAEHTASSNWRDLQLSLFGAVA